MATDESVDCSLSSDGGECSGDEERELDGRRRRFCTERKQELPNSDLNPVKHHNSHNRHQNQQYQHHQTTHHRHHNIQSQHQHSYLHTHIVQNHHRNDHHHHVHQTRPYVIKRPRMEFDGHRQLMLDHNRDPRGRRKYWPESQNASHSPTLKVITTGEGSIPSTEHQRNQSSSLKSDAGPVIYVNPKFVKKFVEKSLQLNSSSQAITSTNCTSDVAGTSSAKPTSNNSDTDSSMTPVALDPNATPAPSTSQTGSQIDEIDLKTTSRESLQAASTMAIVRLVTESIESDLKRDEKFNKILVARLLDQLVNDKTNFTQDTNSSTGNQNCQYPEQVGLQNPGALSRSSGPYHDYEISALSESGSCSSGQRIPVIGGSINNHFNAKTTDPQEGQQQLDVATKQQRRNPIFQKPGRFNRFQPRDSDQQQQDNKLSNF